MKRNLIFNLALLVIISPATHAVAECTRATCSQETIGADRRHELSETLRAADIANQQEQRPATAPLADDYRISPAQVALAEELNTPACERTPQPAKQTHTRATPSRQLNLAGQNASFSCGFFQIFDAAKKNRHREHNVNNYLNTLSQTNWSPCCLPEGIRTGISQTGGNTPGFAFGLTVGVGVIFADATLGRELVIIRTGEDSAQVAIVNHYAASLSWPSNETINLSANYTQNLLYGSCTQIADYLGYFRTVQVSGASVHHGMSHGPWNQARQLTGCNAASLTVGTGLFNPVSYADSYTGENFPPVEIRGPRVRELARLMAGEVPGSDENCPNSHLSTLEKVTGMGRGRAIQSR